MNTTIRNSPGRGPSGKIRNFKSMSAQTLGVAIDDLIAYGEDPEALEIACAVAGRAVPVIDKPKTVAKTPKRAQGGERSADPLGIHPAKIPMKARDVESQLVKDALLGHKALLEAKLDGHRVLVHRDGEGVHVYAGSGVDKTHLVPTLASELVRLPVGTWLDGEGVTGDGKGIESGDWNLVQTILGSGSATAHEHKLRFVAFDLLAYDGLPAYSLPIESRKELLDGALSKLGSSRAVPAMIMEATQENHLRLVNDGYEGSIIKWYGTPYLFRKRGGGWWKLKFEGSLDVVVMGFNEGKDSFSGMVGAVRFGQYKEGALVERGTCSGMDMATRRDMTQHPEKWIHQTIEITHNGVGTSGSLRHPQFHRRRLDKLPADCLWD